MGPPARHLAVCQSTCPGVGYCHMAQEQGIARTRYNLRSVGRLTVGIVISCHAPKWYSARTPICCGMLVVVQTRQAVEYFGTVHHSMSHCVLGRRQRPLHLLCCKLNSARSGPRPIAGRATVATANCRPTRSFHLVVPSGLAAVESDDASHGLRINLDFESSACCHSPARCPLFGVYSSWLSLDTVSIAFWVKSGPVSVPTAVASTKFSSGADTKCSCGP
jgi:hypothetical protein